MVTTHCDQCGAALIKGKNRVSNWSKRCVILNSDELSPCQKAKNKETAKVARKNRKEQDKTDQYEQFKKTKFGNDEAMRTCIRCEPDEDGVAPKFLSKGPYHRICDTCSNTAPGISVKHLSRAGEVLAGVEFMH